MQSRRWTMLTRDRHELACWEDYQITNAWIGFYSGCYHSGLGGSIMTRGCYHDQNWLWWRFWVVLIGKWEWRRAARFVSPLSFFFLSLSPFSFTLNFLLLIFPLFSFTQFVFHPFLFPPWGKFKDTPSH